MDIIKVDTNKTRLISDGGCGYLEVDNSFNSFLSSCNRMYLGVKADIRYTKDRVIVTSRHRDLRKLTNQKIHISLTNYDDLKKIALQDDEFFHITTLSTFLKLCKKYRKIACIEIHPPISTSEIDKLFKELTSLDMLSKCTIIANDIKYLKYIRNKDLNIILELKTTRYNDDLFLNCIKYHLNLTLPKNKIVKDLVDLCHDNRVKIGAYNINDPVTALLLSDFGLDYIYTVLLEEYRPN